MQPQRQPDPAARWLSHVIVGIGVAYVVGKRTGTMGALLMAAASIAAHDYFDAPVAKLLSDNGV